VHRARAGVLVVLEDGAEQRVDRLGADLGIVERVEHVGHVVGDAACVVELGPGDPLEVAFEVPIEFLAGHGRSVHALGPPAADDERRLPSGETDQGCSSDTEPATPASGDAGPSDAPSEDAGGPTAQETATFDRVRQDLERSLKEAGIPGGSIAIVLRGKLAFAAGVGVTKAGESTLVSAECLFRVASKTKRIVAAGVLQEVSARRKLRRTGAIVHAHRLARTLRERALRCDAGAKGTTRWTTRRSANRSSC
jgi:hypothetical protein